MRSSGRELESTRAIVRWPFVLLAVACLTSVSCETGGDAETAEPAPTSTTSSARPTTARPTSGTDSTSAHPDESFVGQAIGKSVDVYPTPRAEQRAHSLPNPNENGAPLVFLLVEPFAGEEWIEVDLPVRPNGSRGWVRASDLTITSHGYRLMVHIRSHHLTVTRFGAEVMDVPVGVGTADTPTPGGAFYVKELLRPSRPDGPYGPYAYGLSGFSNVLQSFGSGDGVIGIHGTDEPSSIGRDVSHGCIRLRNEDIERLVELLPLGTPVEIIDD